MLAFLTAGMTLIYRISRMTNFAHGSLFVLAMYFTFALSRLSSLEGAATPIGIFRQVARESAFRAQSDELTAAHAGFGTEQLAALLQRGDTWSVGA